MPNCFSWAFFVTAIHKKYIIYLNIIAIVKNKLQPLA